MQPDKSYVVRVLFDPDSHRLVATSRLERHLDREPHAFAAGDAVDLTVFGKTPLGYKAAVNGTHSGLLFASEVYQELRPGERLKGYIATVRPDGKIDLTLHPPGRERVGELEARILAELEARGGFWSLGDHSAADEIREELGVSKRTFKQAAGALLRQRRIEMESKGMRLVRD
jgi:uncharacterized protein